VRNARAKVRDGKLADSEALFLCVTAKGHRCRRLQDRLPARSADWNW
jgi:hypothetical protein